MKVQVKIEALPESFYIKVVGVTYPNPDGTERQHLIRHLKVGDVVLLKREPDNSGDRDAVAVFNRHGQQLGYLPRFNGVAPAMDRGGQLNAAVHRVVGGGLLGLLTGKRHYGCVLRITEPVYDWKAISPLMEEDRSIGKAVEAAQQLEQSDPVAAVREYRAVIDRLRALDAQGPLAQAWRMTRYPINRLSLVLERLGSRQEALEEIQRYEEYPDGRGLPATDVDALARCKRRLSAGGVG